MSDLCTFLNAPNLLDMATSVAAVGKMELARTHGTQLPPGWALNKDGRPTTVTEEALPSGRGCGLSLRGNEDTSGYKGDGLALLVKNSKESSPAPPGVHISGNGELSFREACNVCKSIDNFTIQNYLFHLIILLCFSLRRSCKVL